VADPATAPNGRCEVSPDLRFVFLPSEKSNYGYYVYDISNFSNVTFVYQGLDTG
jgi:hypothetical protein